MKLRELTEKIIKLQRDNGFSDEEMEIIHEKGATNERRNLWKL